MSIVIVEKGDSVKRMGIVRDHTDAARYVATGWTVPAGIEMYLDNDGWVRVKDR